MRSGESVKGSLSARSPSAPSGMTSDPATTGAGLPDVRRQFRVDGRQCGVRDANAGQATHARVVQASQSADAEVRRSAWKGLMFTDGPRRGKSRAAAAVA